MFKLAPSILAADFNKLGDQIAEVGAAGAQYLHIDVMDGLFVPSISFGMPVIEAIRPATDIVFDCHLMIKEPDRYVEEFARIGADIITVHLEACTDVHKTLDHIRSLGKKVGLSLNPETPIEEVYPFLEEVDMVLVMSVHPGFGGQKFIEATLDKIASLRAKVSELGLELDIEVDGGIKATNLKRVCEAGANVIVAGSAIFAGDIEANVKDFIRIGNT